MELDFSAKEACRHLAAWIEYNRADGEYESAKDNYDDAQTTEAAVHYRPIAIKARAEYVAALAVLRELGYDPWGGDPVPERYFVPG